MRFLLAIALISLATIASAQNCQFLGNQTYCDNGLSGQRLGNTTYWNDGTSSQQMGNFTYNSDGSSSQRIGSFGYYSDGSSSQQIGNTSILAMADHASASAIKFIATDS
jgi:hypothetical protein